jgi:hypothetical protein
VPKNEEVLSVPQMDYKKISKVKKCSPKLLGESLKLDKY